MQKEYCGECKKKLNKKNMSKTILFADDGNKIEIISKYCKKCAKNIKEGLEKEEAL